MTRYGQVVIGPPGSGKTTYCAAVQDFLSSKTAAKTGYKLRYNKHNIFVQLRRHVCVVNLDPANDALPYDCSINICDLITVEDVMQMHNLGPNGALIYCLDYLDTHISWLEKQLECVTRDSYLLFDFPGQVELYTHNSAVKSIMKQLQKWDCRIATISLNDSHYCCDPAKFISVVLASLTSMIQLETPHINVLSKVDLIGRYGRLPFQLDYFTDALDLTHLADMLDVDPFTKQHAKLNRAISEVVNDYGLVSFLLLNVQRNDSLCSVVNAVDKANGFGYSAAANDLDLRGTTANSDATTQQQHFKDYVREHYDLP